MQSLEKKLQKTLAEGTLVSDNMQPLAKTMLQRLRTTPSTRPAPAPAS